MCKAGIVLLAWLPSALTHIYLDAKDTEFPQTVSADGLGDNISSHSWRT